MASEQTGSIAGDVGNMAAATDSSSITDEMDQIILGAESRVRDHMQQNDGSHDWWHIVRVRNNARKIAADEGLTEIQGKIVDLAALLHDVEDWKYAHTDTAGSLQVKGLLQELGASQVLISLLLEVIQSSGFKEELTALGEGAVRPALRVETAVLQDADRLDAIGAVGIARCFTFGGRFSRVLYNPEVPPRDQLTREQYMASGAEQHTINHFYEKLLKLKGLMKTAAGRKVAEQRHTFMETYLEQFFDEWNGRA